MCRALHCKSQHVCHIYNAVSTFFFFGCCDKNVLSIEMVWGIPSLKRSIYKELPTIAIQDAMNYTAAFCLAFFFHRLHFEALSDTNPCREQYAKTSLWHALLALRIVRGPAQIWPSQTRVQNWALLPNPWILRGKLDDPGASLVNII